MSGMSGGCLLTTVDVERSLAYADAVVDVFRDKGATSSESRTSRE
jgi:hypothetical protein